MPSGFAIAGVIAPVSFVMLSYKDDWGALNVTGKNRARTEATLKELKIYAKLFVEAKSAYHPQRESPRAFRPEVPKGSKRGSKESPESQKSQTELYPAQSHFPQPQPQHWIKVLAPWVHDFWHPHRVSAILPSTNTG